MQKCRPSVQVVYSGIVYLSMNLYIYKVQCLCACPVFMSCLFLMVCSWNDAMEMKNDLGLKNIIKNKLALKTLS